MSTVADLINLTRTHLYGTHQSSYNRLSGSIDASTTSVVCEFPVNYFVPGGLIAIEDELMMIWEINQANRTLTVQRAVQGTTAASHADDLLIEINPRFPTFAIRNSLISEIRSWGNRLWAVGYEEVTLTDSSRSYNLGSIPSNFLFILDALRRPATAGDTWKRVEGRVERSLPTSDFASGMAYITDKGVSSGTLVITYAYPFPVSTFTNATDLQTTVKLDAAYEDIAAMGAAWRLVLPREVKRTFTEAQGEAKDSAEVPPGHITQTAAALKRMRDDRIAEEIRVLASKYPWRVA